MKPPPASLSNLPRHGWARLAALSGAVLLTIGTLLIPIVAAPLPVEAGSAQPKSPPTAAPMETVKPSAPAGAAEVPRRFVGIWTGQIFRSGSGNTDNLTVVVNATETSATVSNFFPGPQTGRTSITGNTMSWNWLLAKWKMTVNEDGQTARIDCDSVFEACRGTLVKRFDH